MAIARMYSVRLAVVKKVTDRALYFAFIDSLDRQILQCPKPFPYAGRGGGIFAGIEPDTIIMVLNGPGEKWYCVGVVPDNNFYAGSDLDGASGIRAHESNYPRLEEGEIYLKSNQGAIIDMRNNGNIRLNAGAGQSLPDIELSKNSQTLFLRANNHYEFSESGRSVSGVIKRDFGLIDSDYDKKTLNYLDGEVYDKRLRDVGRHSQNEVRNRTTTVVKPTIRNPALVEQRKLVYEYAKSYNVKDFQQEDLNLRRFDDSSVDLGFRNDARANRRTDTLNLNLNNFNHLIEKTEGTVVDIYGNILDINRNVIVTPDIYYEDSSDGNQTNNLRRVYDHHRRSIKLHYEINSRKPIPGSEPSSGKDKKQNNAKNYSRWSVDVDGEGLTKINIPASSETGNIPVLSRYINTRDANDIDGIPAEEKANGRKDVKIQQFGAKSIDPETGKATDDFAGAVIKNDVYRPTTVDDRSVTVGTAHHDLMHIANSIVKNGQLGGNTELELVSSEPFLSNEVSNAISPDGGPKDDSNAGGRSLHINLDGSMEMSIGADSVDNKSLVIDTQGGTISHFGRDKNGRSIIHQSDGDVIVQIGSDDTPLQQGQRPGRLEIHLMRKNGTPQKILIDENGLTFDITGNMIFSSTGDMVLNSGGQLLLNGELSYAYGAMDKENRRVVAGESSIIRGGYGQHS